VNLWLDDVREPWKHGAVGWFWAKTADEAIRALKTGRVERASLDHDLSIQRACGFDDASKTGYDVVCWMEANDVWPIGGVTVHSLNPVGRARMQAAIDRHYRESRGEGR
jgi:hypothetical protein